MYDLNQRLSQMRNEIFEEHVKKANERDLKYHVEYKQDGKFVPLHFFFKAKYEWHNNIFAKVQSGDGVVDLILKDDKGREFCISSTSNFKVSEVLEEILKAVKHLEYIEETMYD